MSFLEALHKVLKIGGGFLAKAHTEREKEERGKREGVGGL